VSASPQRGKRPRVFYGWYIIALTGLAGAFAGGTSQAFFGLFVKPIEAEFGWNRTTIAGAITSATLLAGLTSALVGKLADKQGPRLLMTVGVALYGLAYLGMTLITQVWHLYLAYIVSRVAALHLMSGVVPRTAAVNWFRRMRGRALGFQTTAMPLGGAALAALVGALMAAGLDWRTVLASFGAVAMVLLLVPILLFIRRRPEDMGLLPDGDLELSDEDPDDGADGSAPGLRASAEPEISWTLQQALRTKAIWLIGFGILTQAVASGGVSFHMAAYFTDIGLGAGFAAAAASAFLLSGAMSATLWGFLTERYDERMLVVIATIVATILTLSASFITEPVGGLVFAGMYGATTRGESALVMMMLASYFGRDSFGSISGFGGGFSLVGLGSGPLLFSWLFDASGSYTSMFIVATALLAGAVVLLSLAGKPRPTFVIG
jgi:sugar phosphate permease